MSTFTPQQGGGMGAPSMGSVPPDLENGIHTPPLVQMDNTGNTRVLRQGQGNYEIGSQLNEQTLAGMRPQQQQQVPNPQPNWNYNPNQQVPQQPVQVPQPVPQHVPQTPQQYPQVAQQQGMPLPIPPTPAQPKVDPFAEIQPQQNATQLYNNIAEQPQPQVQQQPQPQQYTQEQIQAQVEKQVQAKMAEMERSKQQKVNQEINTSKQILQGIWQDQFENNIQKVAQYVKTQIAPTGDQAEDERQYKENLKAILKNPQYTQKMLQSIEGQANTLPQSQSPHGQVFNPQDQQGANPQQNLQALENEWKQLMQVGSDLYHRLPNIREQAQARKEEIDKILFNARRNQNAQSQNRPDTKRGFLSGL